MQKWVGMVVHANSCRKAPLRPARLAQFGITSAFPKTGALSRLGSAAHVWDGMPNLCTLERQRPTMLSTPSKRSHTFASY